MTAAQDTPKVYASAGTITFHTLAIADEGQIDVSIHVTEVGAHRRARERFPQPADYQARPEKYRYDGETGSYPPADRQISIRVDEHTISLID
ncbi:hypothetical protein ACM0CO_19490 [Mycobacteroides abscessus subsp. abscessus]|uniref:hypothetical protein n=1 Tax=Mycobacteroides abscessus TaxID=36809 RepID=UPI0039EEDCE2